MARYKTKFPFVHNFYGELISTEIGQNIEDPVMFTILEMWKMGRMDNCLLPFFSKRDFFLVLHLDFHRGSLFS